MDDFPKPTSEYETAHQEYLAGKEDMERVMRWDARNRGIIALYNALPKDKRTEVLTEFYRRAKLELEAMKLDLRNKGPLPEKNS